MRLAARMDRIGTETAFEAAARARALEATGRSVIHLEIGEPDFETPPNIREAANAPSTAAPRTTRRPSAYLSSEPRSQRTRPPASASPSRPIVSSSRPAASRSCSSPSWP